MARFMYILKLAGEGGEVPPREFTQCQLQMFFPAKSPDTMDKQEAEFLIRYWNGQGRGLAVYTLVEAE